MKKVKKTTKQMQNVAGTMQSMLKKAINTHVPMITDTPPSTMSPKTVHLTPETFDLYNFEMQKSEECNMTLISKSRDHLRFNKAVNAFRQAGIPANSYSHIAYYQIPATENEKLRQYRYMLLW